jgi:hypothetical protein
MKLSYARLSGAVFLLSSACSDDTPEPDAPWQIVQDALPGALLSVWGTSASDVWAVGADAGDGLGPAVLHFDGAGWSRLETGMTGDLWWVFGFEAGPVYLGGSGGTILRYSAGAFTRMNTPATGVVFGIWGASPAELWAVGGETGGAEGAFAWRSSGDDWSLAPQFPADLAANEALWKVFGQGPDDVWMVGTDGNVLHWDGTSLEPSFTGRAESLFTVHGNSQRFAAVGGFGTGLLLERARPEREGNGGQNVAPTDAPSLIGVCLTEAGGYAVGEFGYVATHREGRWQTEVTGFELELGVRSLHSAWIDPDQGVWAVGGAIRVAPLVNGIILHKGQPVPSGL